MHNGFSGVVLCLSTLAHSLEIPRPGQTKHWYKVHAIFVVLGCVYVRAFIIIAPSYDGEPFRLLQESCLLDKYGELIIKRFEGL